MATRLALLNEPYLSRTDIKKLFNVSRQVAERIYSRADEIDSKLRFRVYPTKVRMQTVLKVQEISWNLLQKQIKADADTSAT